MYFGFSSSEIVYIALELRAWEKNHKLYKLMSQAYMQKHQIKYVQIEYSEKNHLCTYIHKCIDLWIYMQILIRAGLSHDHFYMML